MRNCRLHYANFKFEFRSGRCSHHMLERVRKQSLNTIPEALRVSVLCWRTWSECTLTRGLRIGLRTGLRIGLRIGLRMQRGIQVTEQEDLRRDVIKSDTADISIAELELQMTTGSLGGLVTTVEGLLTAVQVTACFSNLRPI